MFFVHYSVQFDLTYLFIDMRNSFISAFDQIPINTSAWQFKQLYPFGFLVAPGARNSGWSKNSAYMDLKLFNDMELLRNE